MNFSNLSIVFLKDFHNIAIALYEVSKKERRFYVS
jgi:hypothetical protein